MARKFHVLDATAACGVKDDTIGSGDLPSGQATVPFSTFITEDSVTVTGQAGILASSVVQASIFSDNDDVYAQDWQPPIVRNLVAGAGFDILLRPRWGTFSGPVKVNWLWS